nr:hypothetical protein [Pseudoxanthomonas sp.]
MTRLEREAVLKLAGWRTNAGGLNVVGKRLVMTSWGNMVAGTQGLVARAMSTRAEFGGNQVAAPAQQSQAATGNVATQPVGSLFTGEPDAKNSAALDELEGFKPGDSVDVSGRTIGRSTIEMVYRRQMAGLGMMPMARVVGAGGKKLDVLLSELTRVEAAAEPTLDEQLKQVNDELANQGPVRNANTRAKRDQIRTAIAERDFPEILKAVDGNVDVAEAINQALQFAGDEPKAKVIERVLKNRGISDEYRQRWAERLMGDAGAQGAAPTPSPGVVNIPPVVSEALENDLRKQKARAARLRTAAAADGTTLDEKRAAQLKVTAAEATLRQMRTKIFDAEDAVVASVKAGNPGPFSNYADLFPGAEQALVQHLLATPAEPIDVQQVVRGAVSVQKLSKADTDAAAEILKDKEPAADPAKPAPKKKPSADQTRAKADLMAALADLGDILGKNTRMNILPEQEQKLLPVLTRVLDAAFRLGYHKFKDAAKFALDQIRTHLGDDAADALTLQHLQGAYVAMSGSYLSRGAQSIGDVAAVRSLGELLGPTDAGVEPGTAPAAVDNQEAEAAQSTAPATNADVSKEVQDAGTAIRRDGVAPLEPVASQDDAGAAPGRDAGPRGADGQQGRGAAGGQPDAAGDAAARSGGNGAAGRDPVQAGAGDAGRARKSGQVSRPARKRGAKASPAELQAEASEEIKQASPANVPGIDFTITDEVELGKGTEGVKFADNLAAIRTLKTIEQENRRATPDEQRTLARYVGWGGLKNAFRVAGAPREGSQGIAKGWESRVTQVEELLTPAELRAARNSTTAAHYTSQAVVQAVWKAVQRFGYRGGAVLEPSVGTGNFLGLMPAQLRGASKVFAVEYDSLTARIAQHLYPNQTIVNAGLQGVPLPEGKFALAIGNPPFGRESLYFRHNPALQGKSIHNQFFLQSLHSLAEDGVMGMVVSHNLMDAQDQSARMAMAVDAEFLGGIRLPDTAFKENARTEVVTDMLFFRKRSANEREFAGLAADKIRTGKLDDKTIKGFIGTENPSAAEINEVRQRAEAIEREMLRWVPSSRQENFAGSGETISVNPYFLQSPRLVVGTMNATGTMNARADLNVVLDDPATMAQRLDAAIEALPQRAPVDAVAERTMAQFDQMAEAMRLAVNRAEPGSVRKAPDGRLLVVVEMDDVDTSNRKALLSEIELTADTPFSEEFSLRSDGKWLREENKLDDAGNPIKRLKKDGKPSNLNEKVITAYDNLASIPERDKWGQERIALVRDMLPLRDAFKRQMILEASDAPAGMMEDNRTRLNKLYEAFTAKHGSLHKRATEKVAMTMPDGALVLALEEVGKDGSTKPAAILSRRVTIPPKPVERVQDAGEAVAVVLAERGSIDLDRVAQLLGTDAKGAEAALSAGDSPRAFFDPETNQWEPADGYLSGMVRRKLLAAKAAGLEANVAALEKVQPEPWDSSQVTPTMGSNWIPEAVYADFLKHLGFSKGIVLYSPVTNTFTVDAKGQAKAEWATSERGLGTDEIVQRMLNSKPMRVMVPDGEGGLVFDEEGTTETQMKAREIGNEFMEWAFADDDRREGLVQRFNERFNTRVVRQRDGSHLTLPGKVPDSVIKMRPWQLNAIWRGITDNAVLYDHAVGAGKTFTAIARAMERRRMGLSKKPMIVVPNHLVEQWAADARKLYPGANILAATKDDFEKQRRRRLFARIGAGDYDMVIVGHSSFGFIDIDPATEERYLDEELRIAYAAVKEAEEAAAAAGFGGFGKPMGVAQAEQLVKRLEERLAKVRDNTRDRLLTFEQMGIDDLTVDEAHEFKNLAYTSNLQGVAGMGNKTGSGKAMDLNLKIRSLKERPGTSVAFLTGTPISNSVAEMYLVLRNLVPKELAELGMENFDAWRINYVTAADAYEPTESGSLKEVTRLGREWSNMRSLMELYYTVADAVTLQDMKDDYAKANPGKSFPVPRVRSQLSDEPRDREMVAIKPTEQQREILRDIVSGFNELPDIKDRKERNIARLQLMDRARKVSLDARAVDPRIPVPKGTGKIGAVVDRAFQIYEKTADDRGTQLIFLDRSVPKAKGDDAVLKAFDKLVADLGRARDAGEAREVANIEEKLQAYNINEINELRAAQAGGWNAYQEIKDQLVAKGVPASEIRFVQEANTDQQKATLFKQVNKGEVRILIGSTPRMGAGTNVQERLVALHHVDVTWKPSDIEQREGRIVRQQNLLLEKYGPEFTVDVIAYATEMTVDAKMWSLNATKLKAINGVRKYDGAFNMEFDDEESAGMAEMAALATGNPLMVERVVLDGDIKKLEMAQRSFNRRVSGVKSQLRKAEMSIEHGPAQAERLRSFADELNGQLNAVRERSAKRRVTVDGKEYTNDAEALLAATKSIEEQHKKAGSDKARYVVDINGESATSRDRINALIAQSVGDKDFELEVNGKTIIDLSSAVRAIMDLHGDASTRGREFTIRGLKINGMRVDLDVSPSRWRKDASLLSLVLMDRDGVAMYTREHEFDSPVLSGASVRAGLTKLLASDFNPGRYSEWADDADRTVARAKRDLPDLKEQATKTFPREAELREKRARLAEVTTLLQGTSDAARLDNDAPRVTDNGEAQIMSAADIRAKYGIEPNFKDGVVVLTPGGFPYANTPSGTFPTRFAAQKWIREQSGQPINEKQTGSPEGIIDDVVYSSADSTLPARPLSLDRVNQLVQEALSGIRGAPPVEVTARPGDIGLKVPAGSVGYGVTLRSGDIYVFQSAMGSDLDVFKTVFHELFHRGVRVLVPKAHYVQTMLDLAKGDSRIQQLAIEWKNTEMGQAQKDNLRKQGYTGAELTGQYEALAIEEALAAVAEEIKAEGKLGSKPKSMTIRFLANWLAK